MKPRRIEIQTGNAVGKGEKSAPSSIRRLPDKQTKKKVARLEREPPLSILGE